MADVKWVKLMVNVFNNRKIEQIEVMPDGDGIIVIWFKLLCLAGSINDDGCIYFTADIPYTDEMLATQFRRPMALVRLALRVFSQFRMIEIVDNIIHISNWEKYQNTDGMQRIREQGRKRVAKYRENQKLTDGSKCNVTVTLRNAIDVEEEEERRVVEVVRDHDDVLSEIGDAAKSVGLPWFKAQHERAGKLAEQYGIDWLLQAIDRIAIRKNQSWGGVSGILKDWTIKGGPDDENGKPTQDNTNKEFVDWKV